MSVQNQTETLPQTSDGWLRVATKAFLRLRRASRPTEKPAPVGAALETRRLVVGVKKSAVCKDSHGQLRRIDLFLPAGPRGGACQAARYQFPRWRRARYGRRARKGHQIEFRQSRRAVGLIEVSPQRRRPGLPVRNQNLTPDGSGKIDMSAVTFRQCLSADARNCRAAARAARSYTWHGRLADCGFDARSASRSEGRGGASGRALRPCLPHPRVRWPQHFPSGPGSE